MTETATTAIQTILDQTDSDVAAYAEACVHCGECAEACHFYLASGDPKYTPTHKLAPLVKAYKRHKAPLRGIKGLLGLLPAEVTEEELREWEPLVYDSCNMCGRCTLVCPMGIDIAGTIRKMREGFSAAGIAPEGLKRSREMVEKTGSPMGVTAKALLAQIGHQEKAIGLPIPVDQHGAEYMAVLSSMEIMGYPETIGAYARIFHKAGVSWTISTEAYEATNIGVQIGDGPLAKKLVQKIVDAATKLGVKAVISPECGHSYGALRWAGPNMLGKELPFEVVHIIELLDRLRAEGKIATGDKETRKVTLHDPCQIVRRGGLLKEPRRLMDDSCSNFVEMKGAGVANLCCGGGGGVSANARAEKLMVEAFSCKKAQLDAIGGVQAVVVPCGNCRSVFEDSLDALGGDYEVIGLSELVADTLKD